MERCAASKIRCHKRLRHSAGSRSVATRRSNKRSCKTSSAGSPNPTAVGFKACTLVHRHGDPNGGDPNGGDPNGGDPNGGDPNGGDPNGGDPNGGDPNGKPPLSDAG